MPPADPAGTIRRVILQRRAAFVSAALASLAAPSQACSPARPCPASAPWSSATSAPIHGPTGPVPPASAEASPDGGPDVLPEPCRCDASDEPEPDARPDLLHPEQHPSICLSDWSVDPL